MQNTPRLSQDALESLAIDLTRIHAENMARLDEAEALRQSFVIADLERRSRQSTCMLLVPQA